MNLGEMWAMAFVTMSKANCANNPLRRSLLYLDANQKLDWYFDALEMRAEERRKLLNLISELDRRLKS